ncbi:ribosome-recycling factor [endosymbiont of Pachyrhynchus infernalis]|uniref:ribosome recycling factor n=1 Tax=endosymbiont of Pachyrhynchus infernalis TaxID=1971488 RepID=UPI000DC6E211|nr:ribosome-recycling factor [endosymbiont of Pachyrhynchus infernalis]BBA84799.1 ribosome-recycling factor [endosymbiont of Pachyrhynchus infernalis]
MKNIDIFNESDIKINNLIKNFNKYIDNINIGKISVNLISKLKIKYLNNIEELNKLSLITKENSKTLILNPFDKNLLEKIKNCILDSNLDLKVYVCNESYIKIVCSDITEEKRIKIIKIIKENSEKNKIYIRNIRRDFNNKIKNLKNNKEISEDEFNKYNKFFTDKVNKYITYIDDLIKNKEKDLLKI